MRCKLDTEDYENIYLRLKSKLWLFVTGVITFCFAIGSLSAWWYIARAADSAVELYVGSEMFQNSVLKETVGRISDVTSRIDAIENRLHQIEARSGDVSGNPVSIDECRVTLYSSSGGRFYIETGRSESGRQVQFRGPFHEKPKVFISAEGDDYLATARSARKGSGTHPVKVSENGFSIESEFPSRTFSWIAFGQ